MKILVIGGSYFYGRVFTMLAAKEHEITVVNRGTYSMENFGVKQVKGERHSKELWQQLSEDYETIVDFCAYAPGDIELVLENLAGSVKQYLFISTVDVYRRGTGVVKDENTPFEERLFAGDAGEYIAGKVALEKELREVCGKNDIAYTVLRPAILYGPFNYAPREAVFIRMALENRAMLLFTDADGSFQFVYVKDAAEAVIKCLGNEKAYGQAYNLCGEEVLDYGTVLAQIAAEAETAFAENAGTLARIPITLSEAEKQGIPIPFPATAQETELVSNHKSKEELGLVYTDFASGMKKTFAAFQNVF